MSQGPPWEDVTRELVRALRAERSQAALCRRLRYESNVVYLWESGRRHPTPASLFWLVHRTGGDIDSVLDAVIGKKRPTEPPWTVPGAAEVLTLLKGGRTAAELAQVIGSTRHTVGRWMRGDTETRTPTFLALVHHCTGDALPFIAAMTDPASLPSLAERWGQRLAARELLTKHLWTQAVMLALELEDYDALTSHEPGWIAERLGIDADEESRCIELLAAAGQVHHDGTHYRQVRQPLYNLSTSARRQQMRAFWVRQAADRAPGTDGAHVAWRLFTCSERQLHAIKDIQRRAYREMRDVLMQPEGADQVVLASALITPLGPHSATEPADPPSEHAHQPHQTDRPPREP